MTQRSVICNGNPKSATQAVLQIVEALGNRKQTFVRALDREEAYTRPIIDLGGESILLNEKARAEWEAARDAAEVVKGNRAVKRLMADFPRERASGHCHVSWRRADLLGDLPVVTIFRNPRDNYSSWLRWWKDGEPLDFFTAYASFLGWARRPHIIYDDLFTPATVQMLAQLMGRPVTDAEVTEILQATYGRSTTWSGKPSEHRKGWTDEMEETWQTSGGPALEQAFAALKAGTFTPEPDRFDVSFLYATTLGPDVYRARKAGRRTLRGTVKAPLRAARDLLR